MRLKSFDLLTQDYFFQRYPTKTSQLIPSACWLFWGLSLCMLIYLTVGLSDDFPVYINICVYVIIAMHCVHTIPCIYFSSKNRITRNVQGYFSALVCSTWLFQIEFWLVATILGMALTCTEGGNVVNPGKGLIAFTAALAVLVGGVITHILMYRRMKRRVFEGHFRKGGKGFWGDWKYKEKLTVTLAVIGPVGIIIGPAAVLVSNFWTITWDNSYSPFAMIIAPSLAYAMFVLFAYINAYAPIRKYYIRRFGLQETAVSAKGEKK